MNDLYLPWTVVTELRRLELPPHDSVVAGRLVAAGATAVRFEREGSYELLAGHQRAIPVRARSDGPAVPTKAEMVWAAERQLAEFGLWVGEHRKLRLYGVDGRGGLVFGHIDVGRVLGGGRRGRDTRV